MIAIMDYSAGNLTSVKRALDYLGIESKITPDPNEIRSAERIIFPGVGHATSAMETLRSRGLDRALKEAFSAGIPILGICLGTQIILSHSDEGDTKCLDIIEGNCPRFDLKDTSLKIPHMGWDAINPVRTHPFLEGIESGEEFYFVHSYYPQPYKDEAIIATCDYEIEFPVVIAKANLVATQFHPEKSGPPGLRLLTNFAKWDGTYAE
jgi:imidazole glycerol-phosphate synthase subunit HisH